MKVEVRAIDAASVLGLSGVEQNSEARSGVAR